MGILDDENLQKKKYSNIIPLLDQVLTSGSERNIFQSFLSYQFSWCDLQRPEMRKLIRLLDTCNKYNISAEKCQMLERECQDEQTVKRFAGSDILNFSLSDCQTKTTFLCHLYFIPTAVSGSTSAEASLQAGAGTFKVQPSENM